MYLYCYIEMYNTIMLPYSNYCNVLMLNVYTYEYYTMCTYIALAFPYPWGHGVTYSPCVYESLTLVAPRL